MASYISINETGQLAIVCPFEEKDKITSIGAKWIAEKRVWNLAFTPDNVESIIDNLSNPVFSDDIEPMLEKLLAKYERLGKIKELAKNDTEVRLKIPGWKYETGSPYNYQKIGMMFSIENSSGVLLADEMGLGKSSQALGTALLMKHKGQANQVLVIVPASLKYNWALEIEKWTNEKYVIIDGTADERLAQWMRKDVFFIVVNYQLLLEDLFGGREYKKKAGESAEETAKRELRQKKASQRARILSDIKSRVWDLIVIDEAHALKNHNSKQSINVKSLKSKCRIALTGTPLDGKLEELHSVMDFVQPGLLGSKTRFLQRHATTDFFGRITSYRNIGEVSAKIENFYLRRLKEQVLKDLPAKIFSNRIVELTKEELTLYKELAKRSKGITEGAEAMTAMLRCRQMCNGSQHLLAAIQSKAIEIGEPLDKKLVERLKNMPNSKLDAFKEVLQEVVIDNGHKVIIFSEYLEMVKILTKTMKDMGLKFLEITGETPTKDRADYQKVFNESKTIDAIIGTEAMGTGLNLTGASYVIHYSDNWSPSLMDQRDARALRIGQKSTVTVINFICRDTVEERVRSMLYAKAKVSSDVLGDGSDDCILKRLSPQEVLQLL